MNETYKTILKSPALYPLHWLPNARVKEIRRLPVTGFPKYFIFYRIDADMVEVVRVLHAARDLPAIFAADESH